MMLVLRLQLLLLFAPAFHSKFPFGANFEMTGRMSESPGDFSVACPVFTRSRGISHVSLRQSGKRSSVNNRAS